MIIKYAPWTLETFLTSKHPEYAAIRSVMLGSPHDQFVLVGYGSTYEHFRVGSTLFFNLGLGTKLRFGFSYFLSFWLPFLLRPSVIVGMDSIYLIPMAVASLLTRARLVAVLVNDLRYSISGLPNVLRKPSEHF